MKAKVLQALTERNMLKGAVKPVELTELQFQLEMKAGKREQRAERVC